jgi:hypothetical protein
VHAKLSAEQENMFSPTQEKKNKKEQEDKRNKKRKTRRGAPAEHVEPRLESLS